MVTTQLISATELWDLGDMIEPSELIEGELKTMVPPGPQHGRIQIRLGRILDEYAEQAGEFQTFGDAGYILQRNPDTVLGPDLSMVATSRIPQEHVRYWELAPDLAVEIVSLSNAPGEIERKVALYLEAGVKSVWVVYPSERRIVIHHPQHAPRIAEADGALEDPEVLSGFSTLLSRVFVDW